MTTTFVPVQLKMRATGAGQLPGAPAALLPGEVAYNAVDRVLYVGHDIGGANGNALSVLALAGSGAFMGLTGAQTVSGDKTFSGAINFTGTVTGLPGGGSVTSVGLSLPNIFTVSGSPVTSTGTLTGTLSNQNANLVFAGPATGSAAPTFRSLVASDLPAGTGTGSLVFSVSPALTGTVSAENLTLSGDLTVNGTTTNLNSTNLVIEDKNIILGDTATPSDTTADGGGITLKGTTDKTLSWVDATDAWTSSEHLNLANTKEYRINGTSVLSGSTLGSGVTASSLTSVGTIATGTWNGTAIGPVYGGTGLTSAAQGSVLVANTANTYTALDGGGGDNKILAYNAATDTVVWITGINGGTY